MPPKDKYDVWLEKMALTVPMLPEGKISVSKSRIRIEQGTKKLDIPVTEINEILFVNGGYDGQNYAGASFGGGMSSNFYSGRENFLSFKWNGNEVKTQLYLKMLDNREFIFRWLRLCRNEGKSVKLVNNTQEPAELEENSPAKLMKSLGIVGVVIILIIIKMILRS